MSERDFLLSGSVLKKYCGAGGDVVIPEGVKKIGEFAFGGCTALTSVTLPDGVQVIGRHAFSDCKGLVSVELPDGVRMLEWGAFIGCVSLRQIRLPDSITEMEGGIFRRCQSLTEVILPRGIEELKTETFWGCKSLANVTLPESLTAIGEKAFYGCKKLQHISIPKGVKKIGEKAFGYISGLVSYSIDSGESFEALWQATENLYRIYILASLLREGKLYPKALSRIRMRKAHLTDVAVSEDDAVLASAILNSYKRFDVDELDLWICKSSQSPAVKSVLLDYKGRVYPPEKLARIEKLKAEKEMGLRPRSIADWKKLYDVKKCKGGLSLHFYKGDETCVVIPERIGKEKVVAIGKGAFCDCEKMTSVQIPDSVKEIGDCAFLRCEGLADEEGFVIVRDILFSYHGKGGDVTVPGGVKVVSDQAFSDQDTVVSLRLPEGVEKIGELAFLYCKKLERIDIPESVVEIGEDALYGCPCLTANVRAGSYGEKYLQEQQVPYQVK